MTSSTQGTSSNKTTGSTGGKAPNIAEIIKNAPQGGGTGGAVFTPAEGNYVVQTVYQQIFGRNATGNDYAKAYSIAMGQSSDTSIYARQQAVIDAIQKSPEYQAQQDNKYLDAIYNAVAADVRRVRQ
jgi:hypothetical protein